MRNAKISAVFAAGVMTALLAGCQVDTHKDGDTKDVKITTPFGGMRVKTNDAVVLADIGLPGYPGAEPAKKSNGNDDNTSADVNMSFGNFQLRVKAASYRTTDSPERVESFYRDGLRRFGDVIECRGGQPLGAATHTAEGLTCDNTKEGHVTVENNMGNHKLELKAGSKMHQHVVEIDPDGGGTKFGLVALDLPGKMFTDSNSDENRQ